ncbi:hypothetical protein DAPPUDRAFT_245595 [Daphnia pulex]|uniref:Uncharacterized protein n=1 Tax=Daphnia pulex TaxID=6669 RepID=E9GNM9_DAPPU|nr:hypothetical protein DAPPUDRAFT_245595 [Daphnia pulex]|eukprot:EFX78798.1 hypothetical protein DAPPUDRAFT_245595 [Daphnia pulex]
MAFPCLGINVEWMKSHPPGGENDSVIEEYMKSTFGYRHKQIRTSLTEPGLVMAESRFKDFQNGSLPGKITLVKFTCFLCLACVRWFGRFINVLATTLVHDATTRGSASPPCMSEPIDVFDGDCFIGWLWDPTMAAPAAANTRPFRPYDTAPPFDMDDYKDSFEIWHAQWDIFLELSTINTALDVADQPRYKANPPKFGLKAQHRYLRSISVHSTTVGAVTAAELVNIFVAPKGYSASAAQVGFLLDTGAELDAIPRETFCRAFQGVKLDATSPETATGSPIVNDGTFSVTLNWNADDDERRPITATVHVLQDLKQAVLSKSSQMKLGMLPESYPHARVSTLTFSAITDFETDSSKSSSLLFPHLLSRPAALMKAAALEPGV